MRREVSENIVAAGSVQVRKARGRRRDTFFKRSLTAINLAEIVQRQDGVMDSPETGWRCVVFYSNLFKIYYMRILLPGSPLKRGVTN